MANEKEERIFNMLLSVGWVSIQWCTYVVLSFICFVRIYYGWANNNTNNNNTGDGAKNRLKHVECLE